MSNDKPVILFITADGLTDPLGQSQIVPYLIGLSKNYIIHVLSCEKKRNYCINNSYVVEALNKYNISWHWINYRNKPAIWGSICMQKCLFNNALKIIKQYSISLLHCRSYPSALIGLSIKKRSSIPLLFDMRGFWPDERVDRHIWKKKNPIYFFIYIWFKHKEKELFKKVNHIIVLTKQGKKILTTNFNVAPEKISIIPCCSDLSNNMVDTNNNYSIKELLGFNSDNKILAYLGSLGSCYLLNEMLIFFKIGFVIDPNLRMVFFSPIEHHEMVYYYAKKNGISKDLLVCKFLKRSEIPVFLSAIDYSVMFFKKSYSIQASSPTKHGELLSMRIPVVTNSGIGDLDEIIEKSKTGIVINNFSFDEMERAWQVLMTFDYKKANFEYALNNWYSLEKGVANYDNSYQKCLNIECY